jgi:hypothetical protein
MMARPPNRPLQAAIFAALIAAFFVLIIGAWRLITFSA